MHHCISQSHSSVTSQVLSRHVGLAVAERDEPVHPESSIGQRRSHPRSDLTRSRLSLRFTDAEAEAWGGERRAGHAASGGQRAGGPRSTRLSVGLGLVCTRVLLPSGLLLGTEGPRPASRPHAPTDLCLLRDKRSVWGPRGPDLGDQTP